MKKIILLTVASVALWSSSLSTLIQKAQTNELVEIYKEKVISSSKVYDATKSSYMPRVDLGASGQLFTPKDSLGAGQIYNAHLNISAVLVDGFKRENLLDEKTKLRIASEYDLSQVKKDVSFSVTQLYFSLKVTQADLDALAQTKTQLIEQLKRQEKFYAAKLTTEDNVVRLQAAVANIDYKIEVKNYSYDEALAKIYVLTNELLQEIQNSTIQVPLFETKSELDSIKSLRAQTDALRYKAEQTDSVYYPTLRISDKVGYTHYGDDSLTNFPGFERVNTQNILMLNLSMNIIDFSAASEQKQAILAQHKALNAQIAYQIKETNAQMQLAKRAIDRSKKLLTAAALSQKASDRTFEIIDRKYKARVVDYVKYLDALTQKTEAQAQYNRALGALEISYAQYYYSAGFDVKDFIND